MRQRVYLGLDAHIRHYVLAGMDFRDRLLFSERFPTSKAALRSYIMAIKAQESFGSGRVVVDRLALRHTAGLCGRKLPRILKPDLINASH